MEGAPLSVERLAARPNALAPDYSRFRVAERLLLTGHSHQAWPDRAWHGQRQAIDDAAALVDAKWERAFAVADRVRVAYAAWLDDPAGAYALGASTHELLVRFLSALPLRARPRLVTTGGEFHTVRRQLDRLAEEGVEVVRVPVADPASLAPRLAAAVDSRTAAVLVSMVLFESARRVEGLDAVLAAAARHGAELLVDAYHAVNVVPVSLPGLGLEAAWIVGGGYKYCQLGEGNCFLRVPPGCRLRPVVTGWFAEFAALAEPAPGRVGYAGGAARFAGATYDPTSHYRAAAVIDFFAERGLHPELLRAVSQHQLGVLARAFDALDADPRQVRRDTGVPLAALGGFLVLESPRAAEICAGLGERGVWADHRGARLRLGPAPYLDDRQLADAVGLLGEVIRRLS